MASALQAFLHWPVLGPKGHRGLLFVVGYIFAFTLEISETQSLGMVLHARPSCFGVVHRRNPGLPYALHLHAMTGITRKHLQLLAQTRAHSGPLVWAMLTRTCLLLAASPGAVS